MKLREKKGNFVLLKTGAYPMKLKNPFYKKWNIEFEDDFTAKTRDIKIPEYISINTLKEKIIDIAINDDEDDEPRTGYFHA